MKRNECETCDHKNDCIMKRILQDRHCVNVQFSMHVTAKASTEEEEAEKKRKRFNSFANRKTNDENEFEFRMTYAKYINDEKMKNVNKRNSIFI